MDESTKAVLRVVVAELTNEGKEMSGLLHMKEQVVYWLGQAMRYEESDILQQGDGFRLTGTDDGLVYLLTGPGFSQREVLMDFKPEEG